MTKELNHDKLRNWFFRSSVLPFFRSSVYGFKKLDYFLFLILITALSFSFTACDTGSGANPDPDPGPWLIHVGYLTTSGGDIPIYRTAAVTDAQMTTPIDSLNVVARLQAAYSDASFAGKENITPSKVSAIHITGEGTANTSIVADAPKWIIGIRHNRNLMQMRSTFETHGTGDLAMHIFKDAIRLAGQFKNSEG